MKKIIPIIAIIFLFNFSIASAESSNATTESFYLLKGIDCIQDGACSVQDMVQVGINLTKLLMGIIGAVALLFFIYAGIKMIFSQGNQSTISSAKTMMTQTVIGILVFLSAYLIIDFVQKTLLKDAVYKDSGIKTTTSPYIKK